MNFQQLIQAGARLHPVPTQPSAARPARPVVQAAPVSAQYDCRQAPGRKVLKSGVPFSDASARAIARWMGMLRQKSFNDETP